jgi:hypothetical protein
MDPIDNMKRTRKQSFSFSSYSDDQSEKNFKKIETLDNLSNIVITLSITKI